MKTVSHRLLQTRPNGRRVRALLLLALTAAFLFTLPVRGRTAHGLRQDLARLNQFIQSSDSPAMLVFRQGRDLIEREDWAGAAGKFEGYITQYPKDRNRDAALYWLAYAQKKQNRFQEAERTLARLVTEFPRSAWVDDAHSLQVEIAPHVGKSVDPASLDDDELKIVALQSLFQADPARASAYAAEMLKPGSNASRELKQTAVNLLGQRGGPEALLALLDIARTQPDPELRSTAVYRLGLTNDEKVFDELSKIYETERDQEVKGRVLHTFAQMNNARAYGKLLEVARGGGDRELRQMAIHWLSQRREPQAIDDLLRILSSERDDEIRGSVLHAFSKLNDPRAQEKLLEVARGGDSSVGLRAQAIHWLGNRRSDATIDELLRIFRADRHEEIRGAILHTLSQLKDPRARAALLEFARSGDSPDTRARAIHSLSQFNDAAIVEDLVGLYDAERTEEVKDVLLRTFSQSKQERALLKLMDVARSDASRELRKRAVHWLGQTRDPRALKFLQDLLR